MKRLPMDSESMAGILAGIKTRTSRVITLPKSPYRTVNWFPGDKWTVGPHPSGHGYYAIEGTRPADEAMLRLIAEHPGFDAPYSVGETVAITERFTLTQFGKPVYHADATDATGARWYSIEPGDPKHEVRWLPPFLMRAEQARLHARITSIDVGRVQGLTEAEVAAEGYPFGQLVGFMCDGYVPWRVWWQRRWDGINAKRGYPYSMDPWAYGYGLEFMAPVTDGEVKDGTQ